MKPTKPPFLIIAAAWAWLLFWTVVCQAATLPRALLDVQPNLCEVDGGSAVYVGVGLVLTAEHVVRGKTKVVCKFFGGGTYQGVVVSQSRKYDNAYIRIERPKESTIRGLRLSPRDPRSGDTIWKAGYGHNPRKLFWHKGTMNHSYGGWIQFTPKSIGGDSGGPMFLVEGGECFLLGNLWGTDGRNTVGSKPSTIAGTLGTYALDALDTEWHLTANCGPFGCSPRRTQIGGGLFSGGLRQRVTPKAPERRDPSGIAAVVPPLDVDTGLISAQVAAFQADASAAIDQANAATQLAQDQLASERDDRQKAEVDGLRAELEAIRMPAFVDPITNSDPREEVATSQMSMSETAESYLPWIVIFIAIIVGAFYLIKDRKKDGKTSIADVGQAVAIGQQTAKQVEAMLRPIIEAMQPRPATPTAVSERVMADMPLEQPGRQNASPVALARASTATLNELNTQQAEAKVAAKTAHTRALEDLKRDVDAVEALEAGEAVE